MKHRHDQGCDHRGGNRISTGRLTLVCAALLVVTVLGTCNLPLGSREWRCEDVTGERLPGGYSITWHAELPPDRVVETPAGWILDTETNGVLVASTCRESSSEQGGLQ